MRKAKRKNREVDLKPWLWGAVFVKFILGLFLSKITAPVLVRVEGAAVKDHRAITAVLQRAASIPCNRIQTNSIESDLLNFEGVSGAKLSLNLFGRGVLKLRTRKPVAALIDHPGLSLAEGGSIFGSDRLSPRFPRVRLPAGSFGTNTALCVLPPTGRIARLCLELQNSFKSIDWTVEVDGLGMINLRPQGLAKIVFGSSDDLVKKLEVLKQIQTERPDSFSSSSSIVLTSPENPMFVPK